MDLWAYANIDNVKDIASKNGIYCPRLRGYRLMKDEEPVNITQALKADHIEYDCVKDLCQAMPFWNPYAYAFCLDQTTARKVRYYTEKENRMVRWERIHGWKRRVLKTFIHNETARYKKQYEVWNRYAGRDDVLYIHARIGGGNWPLYYKEVVAQPWFIEKVDDAFDSTYCDIYARIQAG